MQTAAFCGVPCAACPRRLRHQHSGVRLRQVVSRSSRRRQARITAPATVSSALALDIGSGNNLQALTNILSAVIVGAGAWYFYRTQVGKMASLHSVQLWNCLTQVYCGISCTHAVARCRTWTKTDDKFAQDVTALE